MKTTIVADGGARLLGIDEVQARLRAVREEVRARHAAEWAAAGFFRRLLLHWRIESEYRCEKWKIVPSRHTLYGTARGASSR